jgi:hypothetical protein
VSDIAETRFDQLEKLAPLRRLPIPGWPEYEIDTEGNVYRMKASMGATPGKALKPSVMRHGYCKVSLCRDSKRHEYTVHRLVAMTFLGEIPAGMDVCHFDGDRANNRLTNLRVDTRAGNMADSLRMGRHCRGERAHKAKLGEGDVRSIKASLAAGETVASISARTGINKSTLWNIKGGYNWAWLE